MMKVNGWVKLLHIFIKIINELDNDSSIDPVAYELYLKGKHTFNDRTNIQDNEVAMELIEKSLSLDPNFIDAKLYQAYMYSFTDSDLSPANCSSRRFLPTMPKSATLLDTNDGMSSSRT